MQDVNLKEIERKAWRSNFQDGLTDIGLGMMILAFAAAPYLESIGIMFPWNILIVAVPAFLVITVGKLVIARPRIGLVKFGHKRQSTQKKLLVLFSFTTVALVTLVIMTDVGVFPGEPGNSMPGVTLMGIIGLVLLVRFLRAYPAPATEIPDAGG